MGEFSYRIPRTIPSVLNSRTFVASMMSATSRRVASPTNPGSSTPVVRVGDPSIRNYEPLRRSFAHGPVAAQIRKRQANRGHPNRRHAHLFSIQDRQRANPHIHAETAKWRVQMAGISGEKTRPFEYLSATSWCATIGTNNLDVEVFQTRPAPNKLNGVDGREVNIVD